MPRVASPPPLAKLVAALETLYGQPDRPPVTEPFTLVLWENAAYLVDDERRAKVYERLEREVGITPQALLDVPAAALADVIRDGGGMHAERRADKLHRAAEIALELDLDELATLMRADPRSARRKLMKFPGLGEPGAEKVLLFNGCWKGLAPDSNALRVLVRVGYGSEGKDYRRTYSSVAEATEPLLPDDAGWLVRAHQLLRTHGQELCKNSKPRCEACPLTATCHWFTSNRD